MKKNKQDKLIKKITKELMELSDEELEEKLETTLKYCSDEFYNEIMRVREKAKQDR